MSDPCDASDPTFPGLHIRPRQGWLNDPNGVCHIDGTYHVFFQFNPYEPVHADVHWGHASSPDLVHWTDEPIALRPRPGSLDENGCWSGCLVDDDGIPTAVYTAVADTPGGATVVLARSDRTLRTWVQSEQPIMRRPDDPAIDEVRDPFVFMFDGHRFAVQGAGQLDGSPQLLLYGCDDLTEWTFLGPFLTIEDPVAARLRPANIWECPNLFRLDDRWVLLVSVWRCADGHVVEYLVGEVVPVGRGLRFVPSSSGLVDAGPVFYAPQVLTEPGRVLLWGWARECGDRSTHDLWTLGWAGVLTFPRELFLDGDRLACRPAAELLGLRQEPLPVGADGQIETTAFEVEASGAARLRLVTPGRETVEVETAGPARILVDGSLVEVFDGDEARTTRAYPAADSTWHLATDETDARVWRLGL